MPEPSMSDFTKKIQDLYEVDIGDFKRKIIAYINRVEEDLSEPFLKKGLKQIKTSVICNNTVEIETLREHLLRKIKEMKRNK